MEQSRIINQLEKLPFYNNPEINSISIRNLENQIWLKPETMWLDYFSFNFRCIERKNGWFKVIVNNETNDALWIKKSQEINFSSWEDYLIGMFGVSRLMPKSNPISSLPTTESTIIMFNYVDCFEVVSMKGDWIEIRSASYCEIEEDQRINSAWIRWKEGNYLLIEYYITS